MENVLIVWVKAELKELAKSVVKAELKHNYSIDDRDLTNTENGFEFIFDDETGGRVAIEFIEDGKHLGIRIKADYSWEAIPLYELVLSAFDEGEEE